MAIAAIVDNVGTWFISGWADAGAYPGLAVRLTIDGQTILQAPTSRRADFGENSTRLAFRFNLPRPISVEELQKGTVFVDVVFEQTVARVPLWKPISDAILLDSPDTSSLSRSFEFLRPSRRREIKDLLDGGMAPSRRLNDRANLCVITYANDAGAWFPYFYNYYKNIAKADAIVVITPKPHSFAGLGVDSIISLAGFPFDDRARAELASGIWRGLWAYYDWVLVCDVDEIVMPRTGSDLGSYLKATDRNIFTSRGFDVLQSKNEPKFDFDKSVLSQRSLGVFSTALCKPHATRRIEKWTAGFHSCTSKPEFEEGNEGLFTLHLKWACNAVRSDVFGIVQNTDYERKDIADYARSSLEIQIHPALIESQGRIIEFDSQEIKATEREFLEKTVFESRSGMWVVPHIHTRGLVNLSAI